MLLSLPLRNDNVFKLTSVLSLKCIDSLTFVHLMDLQLFIAPLRFDLSTSTLIAYFAELECDATLLYLPDDRVVHLDLRCLLLQLLLLFLKHACFAHLFIFISSP